ncbi:MAG: uroporphyrinogen-III synthase [Crocinitomicaceae bacterium]|nr:uroporphyrinogen-III synthase [Crocinitomicaceae bacterium]
MNGKKIILVTRFLRSGSEIRQWAEQNQYQLIEKPFIKTVAVTGLTIPAADWIFFSSPQGVQLYLENYPVKAKKIAALSEGTAIELETAGLKPQFTGSGSMNTREIGQQFFKICGKNETVLFPLSDISRKNVSAQKQTQQVIELVTYQTVLSSEKLNVTPAAILFSSPSNVDGFLKSNEVDPSSHIIAIGETTAGRLQECGIKKIIVSESTAENQLVKTLSFALKG